MLFFTAILCLSASAILAVPVEKANVDKSDYLLPNNLVIPTHYNVEIDVTKSFDDDYPKKFTGSVVIKASATAKINNITLHAVDIETTDISISYYNEPFANLTLGKNMDNEKQFLILSVKDILPNKEFLISIKYEAKLHTDMHGFYVSSYIENNKTDDRKYILTTQFQPTHARKAFPCFDEPKYKAIFSIKIKKPAGYKAVLSNTLIKTTVGDTIEFTETNKMSTYLVAFIVSNLESRQHNENPNYQVWARKEAFNQTNRAVEATVPLVNVLNTFTGIDYKDYVGKLDMAALPDFSAGAMENWGLLTYRETALLFDESVSTHKDLQRIVTVIAHELGHQWFGNLVTTEWWSNTWLNEGFARYIEYMITGRYKVDWEMHFQFVVEQLQNIFEIDSLKKTTPLNRQVYTPEDISSHFGTISYSKGGSVIRMMEHFLGTDIFEKGLHEYLMHRRLSSTVPNNLWEDLEVIARQNLNLEYSIDKIMNLWIDQPGYPLVTVTVDKSYVTFDQRRFFLNPEENQESIETWFIPISYTTSTEKNFTFTKPKLWLTPQEPRKVIELNVTDWLVANIQETGYFRVNYDDAHWKKLESALKSDKKNIDRINRAQIVDDVMNLARAGVVDYKLAFNMADYLSIEDDYYPWYSAFRVFRFLLQRYSETDAAGVQLRTYMKNLMKNLLKEKSLKEFKATKQIDVYNVVSALDWACNLGHEQCVKDAKELFSKNLEDINKNLRSIVYCTAIRVGTDKEWTKLWEKYVNSNVAAEKVSIINALGCSKNKDILEKYLIKSINDDNIRSQDASYVFSAVYTSGSEGVTAALDFLKTNAKKISDKYGGMNALDNAVIGLAARLTGKAQIDQFKAILKDEIFSNSANAAIETTEQNTKWASQYGNSIETILKEKNSAVRSLINHFAMYLSLAFITIYYKRN